MRKTIQIKMRPEQRDDHEAVIGKALRGHDIGSARARILRRSLDARRRDILYVFQVEVYTDDEDVGEGITAPVYHNVSEAPPVHIIGAGPAGYFAALECLGLGLKPVLFERGKDVRERRRDLRAIQQFSLVDPDSNYCFGEGGAGTYSDGKLYTRSTKRGNVREVLETLVLHGAKGEIMIDAHPHIGSNKLPGIISSIRQTILDHGGEVHFGHRVTDLVIRDNSVVELVTNGSELHSVKSVILATGHSARDIYRMLWAKKISIMLKPFALGVRIEHPQGLIDSIQYKRKQRGEYLPPAAYSLACQVDEKGVYSFCMCPGGLVVPAATAPGEIVVNGMSLSRRDSAYANAGTVVSVDGALIEKYSGGQTPMHALEFQSSIERAVFDAGDGSQAAPAQRLADFVEGRVSSDLPGCSYIPGIHSFDVRKLLPKEISLALRNGVKQFNKRMKGYLTNEAVVIATESRTSSPIRIPRDPDTLMHPDVQGLFPCGEGAGYAGGIVSAAVDGKRVARSVAASIQQRANTQ